ncbi:MAG: cobalamin-binding protein [Undibacterium sp.]|nr:cobalamin-binding protein [Undibacterium sp.]
MLMCSLVHAQINVLDDAQRKVTLAQPAKRIVSLAPHVTELVFAAGAGASLVGVDSYSDFPESAKKITDVGSILSLDLERLLTLKPDLVIIWGTGNAKILSQKLRDNQITVFESEPRNYEDVASSIERIAMLAGTTEVGNKAALGFRQRLHSLSKKYQLKINEKPISVFHQMIRKPLMTINQQHIISKAIQLCGGKNVFADLKNISATITTESVLLNNPEVIFSSDHEVDKLRAEWNNFPIVAAVKKGNFFVINGDWIHRFGPRILDGTEQLCQKLDAARKK